MVAAAAVPLELGVDQVGEAGPVEEDAVTLGALADRGPPERPFDYAGGVGAIAPGRTTWTTLSLESGDYVALCVVRGPTDQPHIDLGMITPFSVA